MSLNRVTDVGASNNSPCIAVSGAGNLVSRNAAVRCAGAGFYLRGNDNVVEYNTAMSTLENGFTVDGRNPAGGLFAGTRLSLNKASFAVGQGFAVINGADRTVLTGNVGNGSFVDFCDDGTATSLPADNTFATVSAYCRISHGLPG